MKPIRRFRHALAAKTIAVLATGLLAGAPAFAGYIGHQVMADYYWPDLATPFIPSGIATAGAGVEFTDVGGTGYSLTNVDFSDTNILLTYTAGWGLAGSGTFDGYVFTDLTAADIVGVTLQGTNLAGLTAANLSFNGNQVFLNTLGLGSWGAGTYVSIDVQFAEPTGGEVPEPGALALAGTALLLLMRTQRSRGLRVK